MTTYVDTPLDLAPLTVPEYEPELSLAERFAAFDAANPHVYAALERLVGQWLAAGHRKVGIGMCFEILRWQSGIQTAGSEWRLNNSWRAFYSRRLIEDHPTWTDAIETRIQRAVA